MYFFFMNWVLKPSLVIITLENSLGSPTKDEVVTSLKKRELFPFSPGLTCIVVSLAEHQVWGLTPECEHQ